MLLLFSSIVSGQHDILLLKKKQKTIQNFWVGSTITVQTKDRQWQKGEITEIRNDSFHILPKVIQYSLYRTDTFYFNPVGLSISDVYAMPKKGVLVDYKNGEFQVNTSAGHQHWYWIKGGALFKIAGIAYATVTITNGLINGDLSSSQNLTQLGIAAGLFMVGVLLKNTYKLTWRMGKKYHLVVLRLDG